MEQLAQYKKPIIIVAIIGIVALISWLIYFYLIAFSILSVSPSKDRVATLSPTIQIQTTKNISDKSISFDDGGSGIVASVNHHDKVVVINLYQNMSVDQTYTITLKNIESTNGSVIESFVYTFTPKDDPSLLSDTDTQVILERQQDKPSVVNDPVVNATPFSTDSYVVKSSLDATPDGKGSVSLVATLFPTREDYANGYDAAIAEYKKQITERLSDIDGFSIEKYPITYIIQGP